MEPSRGIEPSKTKLIDGFIMGCCIVILIWILVAMFSDKNHYEDCVVKRPDASNRTLLSPGIHIFPKVPFSYIADSDHACVLVENKWTANKECFELVHIHENHVGIMFNQVTGEYLEEVLQPGVYRIDLGVFTVTHVPTSEYTTTWKGENSK